MSPTWKNSSTEQFHVSITPQKKYGMKETSLNLTKIYYCIIPVIYGYF